MVKKIYIIYVIQQDSGFGGVEVACWPLVPQVRGPKRRIFQGEKILSTPSFGREVKPFVPCRIFAACKRNCSSSFTLITTGRIETYQVATYNIRTLLKMVYWSPKHVELPNVMNKINHQILCTLLDYIYIAKWYTVHTISKFIFFSDSPQNSLYYYASGSVPTLQRTHCLLITNTDWFTYTITYLLQGS